jgi:ornithine--oxo-acid transaminase
MSGFDFRQPQVAEQHEGIAADQTLLGKALSGGFYPEAADARRYCEAPQSGGILAKDTHEHTIRIAPPLVITSDQVDWALDEIGATSKHDFS